MGSIIFSIRFFDVFKFGKKASERTVEHSETDVT